MSSSQSRSSSLSASDPQISLDAVKKSDVDDRLAKAAAAAKEIEETYRKEERERFKRYEAAYAQELMTKYFSGKDIYGDDIYEEVDVTMGIKAGRWTGTESYADPMKYRKEKYNISDKSCAEGNDSITLEDRRSAGTVSLTNSVTFQEEKGSTSKSVAEIGN